VQQDDPLAADTLFDAVAEGRRLGISGRMDTAGNHLRRNQIEQALGQQQQAIDDLQRVLDILANRRDGELARLVKRLRQAETDLADVQRRQGELQGEFEQQAKDPDAARRNNDLRASAQRQQQLQREAERLRHRLERLLAEKAAATVSDAVSEMDHAGTSAGGGDAAEAQRHADNARRNLDTARQQLQQQRQRAEDELAGEQLAQLRDEVKHLTEQQRAVLETTRRFDGRRLPSGSFDRAQAVEVLKLSRHQQWLQEEAGRLAEKLLAAGAMRMALTDAGGDMARAAEQLRQYETGPPTQQIENEVVRRLDLLLAALQPEQLDQPPGAGNANGGTGNGPKPPAAPGDAQTMAELKLLKLLQEDLMARTAVLDGEVAGGAKTEDQSRRYAALSEEQGQLAELMLQQLPRRADSPEDDPENLPDVREAPNQLDQPAELPPLKEPSP
jgi:hypothetical protein